MSTPLLCTTQAEVDAALAKGVQDLIIDAPDAAWLDIRHDGLVRLWGSSRAELRESSSAELRESSRAVLWESSRAELWESSSAVLWGSSSAELWGSSSAVLWGSSSAVLWGSSRAELSRWTSVHVWSQRVTLTGGGHVIDMTALDLTDPATWCAYHGITVADGHARLYKAVNDDLATTYYRKTTYLIGGTVAATDWKPTAQCGNGLHFSPTPRQARNLAASPATRFLAVWVAVADLIPIGDDKCKAPACDVAYEVDIWGDRIEATA